jgi:hypothetical protein
MQRSQTGVVCRAACAQITFDWAWSKGPLSGSGNGAIALEGGSLDEIFLVRVWRARCSPATSLQGPPVRLPHTRRVCDMPAHARTHLVGAAAGVLTVLTVLHPMRAGAQPGGWRAPAGGRELCRGLWRAGPVHPQLQR